MAQIAYRANLSSSIFPMTIAEGGRTVIIPGPDNNFDRRVDPTGEQKDAGIPQILFLENALPTISGYQSTSWILPAVPMTRAPGTIIWNKTDAKALNASGVIEDITIYQSNAGVLTCGPRGVNTVTVTGAAPANPGKFSCAVVRGICYLYEANLQRLYTVTIAGGNVTLLNIDASVTPLNFFTTYNIHTIVGSNNYLVAVAVGMVYYSAISTATDFVSSLVTGAGSIAPNDSNNKILTAKETINGFYLYANTNTIFAQYTGNARYPWKFVPVRDSTGIKVDSNAPNDVAQFFWGEVDSVGHFVIETNNQLKFISGIEATPVAPEVTDFLFKTNIQETFDSSTNTFTPVTLRTVNPTIYVWLNRYIFISVNEVVDGETGLTQYTHVIIYDKELKRYGKLKVTHDFITVSTIPVNASGTESYQLPGFVNGILGTIKYLNVDIYNSQPLNSLYTYDTRDSAILFGKFQYVRSRMMRMEEIEIEGPPNISVASTAPFSCFLIPSLDGRNLDGPVTPYLAYSVGGVKKYNVHNTAQNHSILIKGSFSLNTLQLKFSPAGDR